VNSIVGAESHLRVSHDIQRIPFGSNSITKLLHSIKSFLKTP